MSPAEELRFLILGTQREGNRFFSALLAPLGLTPSQAEVLRCLAEAEGALLDMFGDDDGEAALLPLPPAAP